jgi:putative hydrolase of the HAD superfamily
VEPVCLNPPDRGDSESVSIVQEPTNGRVEAVLLDLYDTLAFIPAELWGREAIAERTGADPELLREAWLATVAERGLGELGSLEADIAMVLEMAGVFADDALLADMAATEYERWSHGVRAFDDSLPCLRRLREEGYRLALVSNCSRQTRDVVPALGLDAAMDAVVLSYEVGVRKPGAKIFRTALGELGVEAEQALFVDDIVGYLDGAADLGIRTVRIDRGHALDAAMQPDTLIGDPGARHPAISSLTELDAFLS